MTITEDVHGQQTALFLKKKKKNPNQLISSRIYFTHLSGKKKKKKADEASKQDRQRDEEVDILPTLTIHDIQTPEHPTHCIVQNRQLNRQSIGMSYPSTGSDQPSHRYRISTNTSSHRLASTKPDQPRPDKKEYTVH